jgi:pimeloyl-ACP methyl ester carboxylesterase
MDIVFTIHGVETRALWIEEIHPTFTGIDDFIHEPDLYGSRRWWGGRGAFRLWRAFIGRTRRAAIEAFVARYDRVRAEWPHASISVVAHSFGTFIVAEALRSFPRISFDGVILCGSIVQCDYNWASARVSRVRNERAGQDWVVRLLRNPRLRRLLPGSGPSGIDGFREASNLVQAQFEQYRHSTQLINRAHCRRHWIPFLRRTEDFMALCSECSSEEMAGEAANAKFDRRYQELISGYVRLVFARHEGTHSFRDLYLLVRESVIREGLAGRERPEPLVRKVTFALHRTLHPSTERRL